MQDYFFRKKKNTQGRTSQILTRKKKNRKRFDVYKFFMFDVQYFVPSTKNDKDDQIIEDEICRACSNKQLQWSIQTEETPWKTYL